MDRGTGSRSEWREGWRVLVAAFLAMMVGWNFTLVVAGLFLKPMQAEFGWSRTELSFGSLAAFVAAFMLIPAGMLIERHGARTMALVGMVMLSSAFLMFAVLPAERSFYYPLVVFLSAAGALTSSASLSRPVAARFRRNLGIAIGIMMSGGSVGAMIAVPALSALIGRHGWRASFVALGAATLIVGLPAMLAWFREPPAVAQRPGRRARGLPRHVLTSANFRKLMIASVIAALPIGGFLGHLIPILTDRGLEPMQAAWLGAVFAGAVGIGKLASGAMLDRFQPARATAVLLTLAAGGAAMLYMMTDDALAGVGLGLSVALVGLAQGAEGDYILYFAMRLFGPTHYARLVSVLALTIMLGMAAGGVAFAQLFDITGSYGAALGLSAILYFLGALTFLSLDLQRPATDADQAELRDA